MMTQTETIRSTNPTYLPNVLLQMIHGMWVSEAIYVVAKLGIADLLKHGAKSSDELAKSTDTDAESLYRVLRALSSIGIFTEGRNRQFQLTPLAEFLRTDVPGSLHGYAIFHGEPLQLQLWRNILHTVKTGKNSSEKAYGMPFFAYLMQNPEMAQIFDQAMTSLTSSLTPSVLASYDFSAIRTVVDVGGGHGILIAEILKTNPTMTGILFDLPSVVDGAELLLEAEGVTDRCDIVGGDIFGAIPRGGDAYIMKHILHGWDSERSQAILENCREAMVDNGKLLILEKVVPAANQPCHSKWLDLQMMLSASDGCERTETEYRELLATAGFKLTRVIQTQSSVDVIEAVKV